MKLTKVRITKASEDTYWYATKIGEIHYIDPTEENTWEGFHTMYKFSHTGEMVPSMWRLKIEDCEVLGLFDVTFELKMIETECVREYPIVKKHKSSDCVVVFTAPRTGVMISGEEAQFRKLYQERTDWCEETFTLHTTDVIIRNA